MISTGAVAAVDQQRVAAERTEAEDRNRHRCGWGLGGCQVQAGESCAGSRGWAAEGQQRMAAERGEQKDCNRQRCEQGRQAGRQARVAALLHARRCPLLPLASAAWCHVSLPSGRAFAVAQP